MTLQPDYALIETVATSMRAILNTLAVDSLVFSAAYWVWRKAKLL